MARARRTDNKGRVLQSGETQDSKTGRYCFQKMLHGRRYTIYGTTLQELREKKKELLDDLENGIDVAAKNRTLNEMFSAHMELKSNIKSTTRILYVDTWNRYIKEDFGKRKVCDVSIIDIKRFYTSLQKGGLSKSSINTINIVLSFCFQDALEARAIQSNPTIGCIKILENDRKKREALTQEQQDRLLDFIKSSDTYNIWYPLICFAICTALRVGELTGLRWSNIDDQGAHIEDQMIYKDIDGTGYAFYLTSLKSAAGYRTVPLTKAARKALIQQKEIDLMTGKTGRRQTVAGADDYIFTSQGGFPHTTSGINQVLDHIVKAYNKEDPQTPLPHVSAHVLRHTGCTRWAESGLPPKTLQTILGHSNISITLNIYVTLDDKHIRADVEKYESKIKIG